jgi:RimJ/RimL family protein N-acetyltransferase
MDARRGISDFQAHFISQNDLSSFESRLNGLQQLRELTASEPLNLQEEHDNQRSWREDNDKLTFIICFKDTTAASVSDSAADSNLEASSVIRQSEDNPDVMMGDINLFLKEIEPESETGSAGDVTGEINLMIAEHSARGKGYGIEALKTFLWYIVQYRSKILEEFAQGKHFRVRNLVSLEAKIGKNNTPSIKLFERLGFTKVSEEPNYFGEFDFTLSLESNIEDGIRDMVVSVQPYLCGS